jgi:HEPN domain-containing protein
MANPRDYRSWISYAEMDWLAAHKLLEDLPAIAAFHAHASAEKYLKAVIVADGVQAKMIHDLVELLSSINASFTAETQEMKAAKLLNIAMMPSRYPNPLQAPSIEEARVFLESAQVLRDYARKKLGLEP